MAGLVGFFLGVVFFVVVVLAIWGYIEIDTWVTKVNEHIEDHKWGK